MVALVGGLSLATFAASRRTASAFTRYLQAADASDLSVALFPEGEADTPTNFLSVTEPVLEAAAQLPGVVSTSTHLGLTSMYLADDGGRALPDGPEIVGSLDGRYTATDRVTVISGRLADPSRADEVVVNERAAAFEGLPLGARRQLVMIEGGDEVVDAASAATVDTTSVEVVGVVRFVEEVLRDEYDTDGLLLASPALTEQYAAKGFAYRFQALHLARDVDPSSVLSAYEALSDDSFGLIVRRTDEQREGAQLVLRPMVVVLAVFGTLAAVTVLALGSFAAWRSSIAVNSEFKALRAMGVPRATVVATIAAPVVAGVAAGSVGAAAVAAALSPLAPIGPIRKVEAERGMDIDVPVVVGGAVALLVALTVIALVAATIVLRGGRSGRHDERSLRVVAGLKLNPAATVGVREGLGIGGRSAAAVRPTIASYIVAVVAVLVTITFGASIDALLERPSRYGWAADRALVAGAGYITIPPDAAATLLDQPDVEAVSLASYTPVQLGTRTVNAMGIEPGGEDVRGDAASRRTTQQ